ncbi:MAG: glycosyltransferase [Candidatus Micrarchaeales archaeon]|nr:glycosyltransferase [Candidatus Micrarchaeales archaeon]
MPEISVIIPTMNEEKYIKHPIEGLKKQSFKDFEVIFVDHNSTDRTRRIARKSGRVIIECRPGIGVARNTGARVAKGRIIVFLDADTRPSRNLLKSYHKAFTGGTVAATGPILPLERTSKRMRMGFKLVSIMMPRVASKVGGKIKVVGSNFAVDKMAFDKVHGFNERLKTYEDWDLSKRLGRCGKIVFVKGATVRTSTRRVEAWGMRKYFAYHAGNVIRYNLLKKPKEQYAPIR